MSLRVRRTRVRNGGPYRAAWDGGAWLFWCYRPVLARVYVKTMRLRRLMTVVREADGR